MCMCVWGGGAVSATLIRVFKLNIVGPTEKAGAHLVLDENSRLVLRFFRQRSIFDQVMG